MGFVSVSYPAIIPTFRQLEEKDTEQCLNPITFFELGTDICGRRTSYQKTHVFLDERIIIFLAANLNFLVAFPFFLRPEPSICDCTAAERYLVVYFKRVRPRIDGTRSWLRGKETLMLREDERRKWRAGRLNELLDTTLIRERGCSYISAPKCQRKTVAGSDRKGLAFLHRAPFIISQKLHL